MTEVGIVNNHAKENYHAEVKDYHTKETTNYYPEEINNHAEEMASNDVASIISSTTSEYDPIKEIAFQLGVDYIEYSDFDDVVPIKNEPNAIIKCALLREQERQVALKYIFGVDIEEQHKKLETEIMRALQNLEDDNLMQLYGVSQDLELNNCMLVLQYAGSGNLSEFLTQNPELPWINRLRIARDIAHGLRQLNKAGVVHGDLHPQNIFINNGKAFIKAPRMFSYDDTTLTYYNSAPKTIHYVDPEIMGNTNSKPNYRSDIYSLGIVMWEISSGKSPFQNFEKRLDVVPGTPEDYIKLYEECLDHDPEMRPTIEQVCEKLDNFLYDNPSSRRHKEANVSDDDLFTFEEEPINLPTNKLANGLHNSDSSPPAATNEREIRRHTSITESNTLRSRPKRYSKLFQNFKIDIYKTKTKFINAWSKVSCIGGNNLDDKNDK